MRTQNLNNSQIWFVKYLRNNNIMFITDVYFNFRTFANNMG